MCNNCRGMSAGHFARGWWLFWDYPLTRYHLALAKGRRLLNKIRLVTFVVIALNFWTWLGFLMYKAGSFELFFGENPNLELFLQSLDGGMRFLFWLGALSLLYVYYRIIRDKEFVGVVEHYDYKLGKEKESIIEDWRKVFRISRKNRHNISDTFTEEALVVMGESYEFADKSNHITVEPIHLFYSLLNSNRISNLFVRLGIPVSTVQDKILPIFAKSEKNKTKDNNTVPLLSPDYWQLIFQAYEEAYVAHQDYVSVTELFLVSVQESEELQEIFYDLGVDKNKLINVVQWARIKEKMYRQFLKFRKVASHRSKTGMDKAMTALATPYLNQFSDDMTLQAQYNHFDSCVAREQEIEEVFRIVEGGGQNVLLVGDHGVGKRSIIEGLAQKMVEEDVPDRMKDRRMVRLSISSLLAGTTPAGAVERLIHMMNEIARARNIVLVINNLHELAGVSAGGSRDSLDVADTLAEYLKDNRFLTLATTTDESYAQHITNSTLGNVFTKVEIKEMDEDQAIQVLESKIGVVEFKQNVFFAYDGLEKAVKLTKRFLHDIYLPGSALEIVNEAAAFARAQRGANCLVSGEDVARVLAEKTKIPMTTVSSDESTKLMQLEEEMHHRVIGQDEAVNMVANALRRARAEIRSTSRPIANFLFMGPTGVGKTELAKTIAEVYFGGETRMTRLDMSEYQDKTSIYRLIGAPGEKGTGILTEAVRRNPFCLLLLDEIEKADKDIINLFLQVMDDGRLTDSTGRVVDFTNVILVATTNAGTSFVQEQMRAGSSSDDIKEKLLHGELKQYFRPEFLNRFDGIVLFKALAREDIKKIAGLMLKRLSKDLEVKGMELVAEERAIDFLADVGFDPEFGARPMRRAIQEKIENRLAELLLSGKLKRRDKIIIGEGGTISVV